MASSSPSSSPTTAPRILPGNDEDMAHLMVIPSCAAFLSRTGTVACVPSSRSPGEWRVGEHFATLFGRTFKTDDTVKAYVASYIDPSTSSNSLAEAPSWEPAAPGNIPLRKCSLVFSLGNGLNGWPGSLHGSVSMALMDEAMATLLLLNERLQVGVLPAEPEGRWNPDSQPEGTEVVDLRQMSPVTARVEMDYVRRVPTPGPVIVNAWVESFRPGKRTPTFGVAANICDMEGRELVRCKALWAGVVRGKHTKL